MNTREMAEQYRLTSWTQAIAARNGSSESIREFCARKGVVPRHDKQKYERQKKTTGKKNKNDKVQEPKVRGDLAHYGTKASKPVLRERVVSRDKRGRRG
jgi:hypothetical protein